LSVFFIKKPGDRALIVTAIDETADPENERAGLPGPDFEQRGPYFVVTVWRDWLTREIMTGLGLEERQMKAVMHVKVYGRITNRDYCDLTETIYRTASRDLQDLVSKGVLRKIGATGRNVHYVISRKQDINRTNRTPWIKAI